jgi:transcriptional regulator with XRE-family HTH domain
MTVQPNEIISLIEEKLRTSKNVTRKALADKLGVDQSYISKLLKSGGDKGRFAHWLKMIESCGLDFVIKDMDHDREGSVAEPTQSNTKHDETSENASELRLIITIVEKALAAEGLALPPEKKAELIALLYELYCDSGKNIQEETVKRYLRLVA